MIRRALPALLLLAILPGFAAAHRDPLAPVSDLPHPMVAAAPGDLFQSEQIQGITGFVHEARQFGVPLAVRVISMPTSPDTLHDISGLTVPSGQEIVQRIADTWLAEEALETSPGAADGILLFVIVPTNDHTQTMAAFATGKNALPLNGLTQHTLDDLLDNVIRPFFRNNTIAVGIQTGIATLSYDNLFASPARLERTHQQGTLFTVTNTVIFGLTAGASLALACFAWWIRSRNTTKNGGTIESPFEAGALLRGRVDDTVVTAALLHLVRIGVLTPDGSHLRVAGDIPISDPFAADIASLLLQEADRSGALSAAAHHRIQDVLDPARSRLEDQLAAKGMLNSAAKVESTWLVLASVLAGIVTLMAVVPSIASMSRIGIAGILIAVLTIIGVLVWTARRSWVTPGGRDALRSWQDRSVRDDDHLIVDIIVNQDALLDTPGGPDVPSIIHLTRQFRALGAG